jgi:Major Facilitator Superfamily
MTNSQRILSTADAAQRERLLRLLTVSSFLIFFQAYMVAPIIPALAAAFHAPVHTVALVVPAYLIPYGIGTILYGIASDRFGTYPVMLASLAAFIVFALATATSSTVEQIIVWRVLTGLVKGNLLLRNSRAAAGKPGCQETGTSDGHRELDLVQPQSDPICLKPHGDPGRRGHTNVQYEQHVR